MPDNSKIRIAFVIESLGFGGREKVLLEIANGLDAQYYDVHIITFSNDTNAQAGSLNNNIQLYTLPFISKKLVTPSNIFLSPSLIIKFKNTLKKIRPDIVHTHFLYQLLFLASVSLKLSRLKIFHFHTIHTAGSYFLEKTNKNNFILKAEGFSIHLNHAYLVTVSKQLQDLALQFYKAKATDIRCIINGVDDKKFDFHLRSQIKKTDWGFTDENIIVSYVARFDKAQKDHITLLKAWQLIAAKNTHAKLCLAGDGEGKNEAEEFVQNNSLNSSVFFLGNIPNINELLAVTDIGVFTSRYEGLSVALLEKMFMKLPVVVTNIPAFSTIVKNEESGYLFDPGNHMVLAEKLLLLFSNKELRCAMGNNAYNAVKDYTIHSMVTKHDEYYHAVLSNKNFR